MPSLTKLAFSIHPTPSISSSSSTTTPASPSGNDQPRSSDERSPSSSSSFSAKSSETPPVKTCPPMTLECGDAGCLMIDGKPTCMCVESSHSFFPPDNKLRCHRTPINERSPAPPSLHPIPPSWDVPIRVPTHNTPHMKNNQSTLSSESNLQSSATEKSPDPPNSAIPVAIGCASAVVLVLIAVVIVLRRRPFQFGLNMKRKNGQSPVVWLQRQDGARLFDRLTIVSSNEAYYSRDFDDSVLVNVQTKLIPIDDLKLEKEIGEGTFGKVYKGVVTSGFGENGATEVAVKVLKDDVSREMRNDFRREVEIMSSFDHENILKLLGVVSTDFESPYMVFEFMEYGDLTDILRRNDTTVEASPRIVELKSSDLVDISLQIVQGMIYLASRRFVHRDLATRNCLVGSGLIIKIADFGMSRDLYTCDYYKVGGNRHLPVRWMAPESIKYGRYGAETDVWSYGVVLWEIFAYGRQPYYGHSNEEAIRFIEEGILLQKPSGCSDTVYHVMLGCWRRDANERFTFQRIHRHLLEYEKNRKQ